MSNSTLESSHDSLTVADAATVHTAAPAVSVDGVVVEASTATQTPEAHASEAQFERYDTINTPKIALIGFISAILTFVAIMFAQVMFFSFSDAESKRKQSATVSTEAEQALTRQQNQLTGYRWVDPQQGVVSIPIDEAMRLVVAEKATDADTERNDES